MGLSYEKSGCISLRQVIEAYEERKRLEAVRKIDAERLRKSFVKKKEAPETDEQETTQSL